jgi:DNA polymerase III alpha subunit
MQDRAANGEYKNLEDFMDRFDKRAVNKKALNDPRE